MTGSNEMVLIDAHVHLYACHELAACLDHARANFDKLGEAGAPGVLLLCEMVYEDRFVELAGLADRHETVGRWRIERTGEDHSLLARNDAGAVLVIIAGRQIVTSEGLEVLALFTTGNFEDRVTLHDAIDAARAADAVVVIPYGVGKWSGRRGRLVEAALQRGNSEALFLGDNGNRLAGAPRPRLLRGASRRGTMVLPGSDPLPLPGQHARVGGYGMILPLRLDLQAPARQIRSAINRLSESPKPIGSRTGLLNFLRLQVGMQFRKRKK